MPPPAIQVHELPITPEQIARVVDHGAAPAVLACRPVARADGGLTVEIVAGPSISESEDARRTP